MIIDIKLNKTLTQEERDELEESLLELPFIESIETKDARE